MDLTEKDAASRSAAICLEDVCVTYRRGDISVNAIRGVKLEIMAGDFVSIEGPSGSGKSTLLRAMAGLGPVTSGSVRVEGVALEECSDAQLSSMRRRRIGFVHQLFNLLPDLTVAENVAIPLLLDGLRQAKVHERTHAALSRIGIESLAERRPEELSGGEMLRVALTRALVIEPLVILADEPTGSLDRDTGSRVLEILRELNLGGGVTIVVVTHDAVVAAAASRRLQLTDGHLVER